MKRLSTGILAAIVAASSGLMVAVVPAGAYASGNNGHSALAQASNQTAPPDFGSPPTGEIPILYNDHHVYSRPDVLKKGRVLSALVRGGSILVPLRSMFEQMGATVSYDAATKTATISKPGAQVQVTVGKPEVVINGESRPLDVAPEIYRGNVLVPIRVISEGMGAYVQWVPDQHVVVVRYLPPTPPPPPATAAPTPVPTTAPTPTPAPSTQPYRDLFVAGDYIISPKVYNELSPGNTGNSSFAVRGAAEFKALSIPWMIEGSYERYQYPHNCNGPSDPQCYVTAIGGAYSTYVTTTQPPSDQNFDVRLGLRVAKPRIYIGAGYLWMSNNYGYPNLHGVGFGAEKLPDLDQKLTAFGSIYYYPNVKGTYTNGAIPPPYATSYNLAYNILKYQVGAAYTFSRKSPVFIEAGWMGDGWTNKTNGPVNRSYNGPFVGLGIKLPN